MNQFDQDALIYRANKEIQFHDYLKNVRTNFNCQKISYFIPGYNFVDGYLYYPETEQEVYEVIFNLHGGGNVLGQFELDDKYCQLVANQTGKVVVNIDYLLAPEVKFPGPILSTYQFVQAVCNDQAKYKLDCSKVSFMGNSAGGYISTCLAVLNKTEQKLVIDRVVANYAPFVQDNFDNFDGSEDKFADRIVQYRKWYFENAEDTKDVIATPLNDDLQAMPKMFIISAEKDLLKVEEEQFVRKLAAANVQVIHKLYSGCMHGFTHEAFNEYNSIQAEIAWSDIVNFLLNNETQINNLTEL